MGVINIINITALAIGFTVIILLSLVSSKIMSYYFDKCTKEYNETTQQKIYKDLDLKK